MGRRIDPPDAPDAVFPYANADRVRAQIVQFFKDKQAAALVCSAACGADLLALQAAETLTMRRRILLPFDAKEFRRSSVTDRPGDWGPAFDHAIAAARASADLIDLGLSPGADESYLRANDAIIEQAVTMAAASGDDAAALLVWNGEPRPTGDMTSAFETAARAQGLQVFEISTL